MELRKLTGPSAGAMKYDILTALSVAGMQGGAKAQVSMMRLISVITARYNWRREELSLGQRDMARMWGVTERTVKREIKSWLDRKLLICTRPGVRGRVAAYRLNMSAIYDLSEPFWPCVGTDFVERMGSTNPVQETQVVQVDFAARRVEVPETGSWRAVAERLRRLHPAKVANWLGQLRYVEDDGRHYVLRAESVFAARFVETHLRAELIEAIETEVGPQRRLVIEAGTGGGLG